MTDTIYGTIPGNLGAMPVLVHFDTKLSGKSRAAIRSGVMSPVVMHSPL